MDSFTIIKPDDMHLHLRQGELMNGYVQAGCGNYSRGVVMPNTQPPILTVTEMEQYKEAISLACKASHLKFQPCMTFQITPSLTLDELRLLKEAGAVGGKYYPVGVTTNSENGMASVEGSFPLFEMMENTQMPLLIHGESQDAPVFERERAFLSSVKVIAQAFPRLKIVLEHLSTKEGVDMVASLSDNVASTVTVHHLLFTKEDLMASGMVPHLYCKPLLQNNQDRSALREWVFSGSEKVFFGSDSAPHPKEDKESSNGKAGVFSSPVAMSALATLFDEAGKIDKLEAFVSISGARFYGWEINREKLKFIKESWVVPEEYFGSVPLFAGKSLAWKCVQT